MKILLGILAVLLLGPFLIGLSWAFISNVTGRTRRAERASAIVMLASMPDEGPRQLRRVWEAFRRGDIASANRLAHEDRQFGKSVTDLLRAPRAAISSAGVTGDAVFLEAVLLSLIDQGYSRGASSAIAAVQYHHLEDALEGMSDKDPRASVAPQGREPAEPEGTDRDLPTAAADAAEEAPTMTRVLMDTVYARLRREYPNEPIFDDRVRFSEAGCIGGCVYLAICLHHEVSSEMRTPLEQSMRRSLVLAVPDADEGFAVCSEYVREAVLEVPKSRRAKALPVLVANWVVGSLNEDDNEPDPMHVALVAQVYANELTGYWRERLER